MSIEHYQNLAFPGISEERLKGIRELRLMNDVYFTVFFDGYNEGMEQVLQVVLARPDIQVRQVVAQRTLGNLYGRGVRLDVLAVDTSGKLYNVEVQRASKEALPRRARYNSSMMDAREVEKGTPFQKLPETYVIFITEYDIFHEKLPIYTIDRRFSHSGKLFGDDAHIVYVNGECQDDSDVGRLMQDFFATDPGSMHYESLAKRSHYLKDEEKGVDMMNDTLEKIMNEREHNLMIETAKRLLSMGLTPEKVVTATKLTLEEVEKLAKKPA